MIKKRKAAGWTWREYLLQLSVVIVGIFVTFAGSDLVSRRLQARDVKSTMKLIHMELLDNRAKLDEILDWMVWERHACDVLSQNRDDLHAIPADTMLAFAYVAGRIYAFHPRCDAYEVLKSSGLMARISDKETLVAIARCYAALDELSGVIDTYYQQKIDAQNQLARQMDAAERDRFFNQGPYETWAIIFSKSGAADFFIGAPYYFTDGYLEGLTAEVDDTVSRIAGTYRIDPGKNA